MSSDITRDKNMIVQGFKKKGLSKEVMELKNYDADYGLTWEQIAKYADKKMDKGWESIQSVYVLIMMTE